MLQAKKMMEGWDSDAKEIAQKGSLNLTFDCIYLLEICGWWRVGTKHKTRPFALLERRRGLESEEQIKHTVALFDVAKQYD